MDSTTKTNNTHTSPAQSIADSIKLPVEELTQQGKEKAGQLADQARDSVQSALSNQKGRLCETLGTVSNSLVDARDKLQDQGNQGLGSYLNHGHEAIDKLSGYLRDREIQDIAHDVQTYAHRNPTLVVGALFAAGFIAGRFLRSSAPPSTQARQTTAMAPYYGLPAHRNALGRSRFEDNLS